MGFDGWFFARGDADEKRQREANNTMEFIWSPYEAELGSQNTQILTHFLYHHYNPPKDFHFDSKHRYSYFNANHSASVTEDGEYNAVEKSAKLTDYILEYKRSFGRHNQVLMMMGDDFSFARASVFFKSSD